MPIIEQVLRHSCSAPLRNAFEFADEIIGYADLAHSALELAHRLNTFSTGADALMPGHEPQGIVALSLRNSPAFVRAFAGSTASACATAVLDPSWAPHQTRGVLARLRPDVLITDSAETAGSSEAKRCHAVLTTHGVNEKGNRRLEEWAPQHRGGPVSAVRTAEVLAAREDHQILLIGFTSGTTSAPKAFVRTRCSWRESLPTSARLFRSVPDEVTLAPGPLAHGLSLYGLTESLFAGGTLISTPGFRAQECARIAAHRRVSRFLGVPTMLRALADAASGSEALVGLRTLVSSGAKLHRSDAASLAELAPHAHLIEYYGASELSFVSTVSTDLSEPVNQVHASANHVGRPFPGVELSIRSDTGEVVGEGQPGTVFVRSPFVCEGYLGATDDTGFRRSGEWATVGDQGYVKNGALHIIGRQGEMLISGGFNVYPSELEGVLRETPPFSEAQVMGVPDAHLGVRIVAVLHSSDLGELTSQALRGFMERRLPGHKIPREFYSVERWPLTSSGKINKRTLIKWIVGGRDERIRRIE